MKEIESHFSKAFLARQGTSFAELIARIKQVAGGFEHTLSNVDDGAFYAPVAENKWSPAQIADHVVTANGLFTRSLERVAEGKDIIRMPRGRVTEDGRPIAPGDQEPRPDRARADLLNAFAETCSSLTAAARQLEREQKLSETCLDQAFFGPMTGLECLQLAAWHIRHHTKQLAA